MSPGHFSVGRNEAKYPFKNKIGNIEHQARLPLFMFYRVEEHSHVQSVRAEGCVTELACLSHYCALQDATVLRDPLLLKYALRSVSCLCLKMTTCKFQYDVSLPFLSFKKVLLVLTFFKCELSISFTYLLFCNVISDRLGDIH